MKKKFLFLINLTISIFTISFIINKFFEKHSFKKSNKKNIFIGKLGTISYSIYGEGKPLLLIHSISLGGGDIEWENNIEELSQKFKVYVINLPGFDSSIYNRNREFSFVVYSSIVNDFIKNVIKEKTFIIGSNQGAIIAMLLAVSFDNMVEKILLISPRGMFYDLKKRNSNVSRETFVIPIIGTTIYNIWCSNNNIKSFFINEGFFNKKLVTDKFVNARKDFLQNSNPLGRFWLSNNLNGFFEFDMSHILKNIKVPVLIIYGKKNTEKVISETNCLKEEIKNCKIKSINDSKMFPHYEVSQVFNEDVINFFNKK